MTAAVLTPFYAPEAVELGNRQWVKKLLPVGSIDYKGRRLEFTRDYLGQIVRSFQSRAYDQVPFQLADSQNTHTNDPERTRGEITGMELRDDGLYVTASLTPEGEAVLTANPKLGVSARIVEEYARADGKHFPAAVQHVLGTLDPRIPGLGAWEAVEMSNTPALETVVDLTAERFVDLVGPEGYVHGYKYVGGPGLPSSPPAKKINQAARAARLGGAPQMPKKSRSSEPEGLDSHGKPVKAGSNKNYLTARTKNLDEGDTADRMSKNLASHYFPNGADSSEGRAAHREVADAHRQAAKATNSTARFEHHTQMAKLHSSVATGRATAAKATSKMDLAGDGDDLEGAGGMPDLQNLSDEQQARLAALLSLPDEQFEALADGGTVLTPDELEALAGTGDPDEDDGEDNDLAALLDGMTDEDIFGLEAEFEAQDETDPGFTPGYMPEGEPVGASLSAEAQFSIDLANARADETARELRVVTARLREEDYQAEKRRLADAGVSPYITELARPLLEGAGHAVELSNGKTVDAGAIMRQVLTEYAAQARLLDLDVELGSPMDMPEDAGREQAAQNRADLVAQYRSMTGL